MRTVQDNGPGVHFLEPKMGLSENRPIGFDGLKTACRHRMSRYGDTLNCKSDLSIARIQTVLYDKLSPAAKH